MSNVKKVCILSDGGICTVQFKETCRDYSTYDNTQSPNSQAG